MGKGKQKEVENTKAVATKASAPPVVAGSASDLSAWGPAPKLTARNTVIGRILLMQSGAEAVKKRQFAEGDLVLSTEKEVLAHLEEEMEVVPFRVEEKWAVYDIIKDRNSVVRKWRKTMPLIEGGEKDNANLPFEDTEDGKPIENVRILDFYVIRPDAIDGLPVILSFRKTSLRAGKELYTRMFGDNAAAGLVPAAYTAVVTTKLQTNDKGTFVVMETKRGRPSSNEELAAAFKWHKLMSSGKAAVKVDNSDIEGEEVVSESTALGDEPSDY